MRASKTFRFVSSNTFLLHLHCFKRLYLNLHDIFLMCFYGSRGRVTRLLHY
ncbi:hypothetical protein E2C01_077206 [Portunus trituberculatus]|uniref:Uncharacterized protein n=1 Tax=Portunus trituberculatus TaxID=210409 RepID=A0A5B7IQR2_PORTR|nr:hypothetical protein [Portunus trituberculatus]